jgi:hypothetical protein
MIAFPYDAVLRFALKHKAKSVAYESLSASLWGARLSNVRLNLSPQRTLLFDECRIRPAGIFPPAVRLELAQNSGKAVLTCSGWRMNRLTVEVKATDLQVDGFLLKEVRIAGRTGEEAIQLTEILLKTDQGGFEGTGEIRPARPIRQATLIIKGQAMLGSTAMPIDKSILLSAFFPSGSD